jgi:hypothetical protein
MVGELITSEKAQDIPSCEVENLQQFNQRMNRQRSLCALFTFNATFK